MIPLEAGTDKSSHANAAKHNSLHQSGVYCTLVFSVSLYLLHASCDKHVTICHDHDGGIPAASVRVGDNFVGLCGGVILVDCIEAICQEVSIEVQVVT